MSFVSRGFRGRRQADADSARVPPGQYVRTDYPVLSAGPTPHTPLDLGTSRSRARWTQAKRLDAGTSSRRCRSEEVTVDIHCVTKWSKLDTHWEGISIDTLLERRRPRPPSYVIAFCDGGYTTNLPLEDVTRWQGVGRLRATTASRCRPNTAVRRGLLVPHLYFWKSAKWVRGCSWSTADEPGFWESTGYNNHGDPWKEQRYWGD